MKIPELLVVNAPELPIINELKEERTYSAPLSEVIAKPFKKISRGITKSMKRGKFELALQRIKQGIDLIAALKDHPQIGDEKVEYALAGLTLQALYDFNAGVVLNMAKRFFYAREHFNESTKGLEIVSTVLDYASNIQVLSMKVNREKFEHHLADETARNQESIDQLCKEEDSIDTNIRKLNFLDRRLALAYHKDNEARVKELQAQIASMHQLVYSQ